MNLLYLTLVCNTSPPPSSLSCLYSSFSPFSTPLPLSHALCLCSFQGGGRQTYAPDVRNNDRCIIDDAALAEKVSNQPTNITFSFFPLFSLFSLTPHSTSHSLHTIFHLINCSSTLKSNHTYHKNIRQAMQWNWMKGIPSPPIFASPLHLTITLTLTLTLTCTPFSLHSNTHKCIG